MTEKLYQMLKDDHNMVKDLLREASENEDSSKFREIKTRLNMHMNGEEKFFYPPLKAFDEDLINQSFKEHDEARKIIEDMEKMGWQDERWIEGLKKLKESVENHVQKEENLVFAESTEVLPANERYEIANKIEEDKISKRSRSIPDAKLVHLPQDIDVPKGIPASEVKIPSMYAEGEVEYEDSGGTPVDKSKATHIRFTGIDRRSDIVVGPIKPKGMIRLTLYLGDDNLPQTKEKATDKRSKIFNEQYRPIKK